MQAKHKESALVSRWVKSRFGDLEMHWQVARAAQPANATMHLQEAA